MIAIIRIRGQVGLNHDVKNTLHRLRLRKKYTCIVLDKPTPVQLGMLKKVENFVAFGEIDKEAYEELVKARGKKDKDGKLKPFFGLHPPRKGIDAKKHFGVDKGVLGNNREAINQLIRRML